jgi:hypothetical protein
MLLCSFLLALSSCYSSDQNLKQNIDASGAQQGPLVKVEVKAVDFLITTFVAVDCQSFLKQFPEASISVIKKPSTLRAINQQVSLLKTDTSAMTMDARAQAVLYYLDGHTSIICLGKFATQQDGREVTDNTKLRTLLGLTTP